MELNLITDLLNIFAYEYFTIENKKLSKFIIIVLITETVIRLAPYTI